MLDQASPHAIAFEPGKMARLGYGYTSDGTSPTLRADPGDNLMAVAFTQNQRNEVRVTAVVGALAAEPGAKQQTYLCTSLLGGIDYENNGHTAVEPTGPLLKGSPTGGGRPLPAVCFSPMQVRRLTPVECERLQGFPDGYTNIPWRGKPESPDGPRYKALGNSWAVPNVRWIGERIQKYLDGSL
jgi:DNA (cytosine-5)-methyltransferase 1